MTRYKEKKQVSCERSEVVRVTCDRCGEDMPLDVENGTFMKEKRAHVEVYTRESYPPEGGYYTDGWRVPDICDECAKLLRKLLYDNGFKISKMEW